MNHSTHRIATGIVLGLLLALPVSAEVNLLKELNPVLSGVLLESQNPLFFEGKVDLNSMGMTPHLSPKTQVTCRAVESATDLRNDGREERIIQRGFNDDGQLFRATHSFFGEWIGETDFIDVYNYNNAGECTRITRRFMAAKESLRGIKGTDITTFEYNSLGLLVREVVDFGDDGIRDLEKSFLYNRRNEVIAIRTDSDMDGAFDSRIAINREESGLVSSIELRTSERRSIARSIDFIRNEWDQIVRAEMDTDGDGFTDLEEIRSYDGNQLTGSVIISTEEKTQEAMTLFGYDDFGNLTLKAVDWNADGIFDSIDSTLFECP